MKIADLQAHIAPPSGAIWACRSAIFEKSWECAWGFSEKCQNLDIRHFWNFFAGQNGLRGYFSNFVKNWIGNWKNWTNCRFWKFFTKFCDFFFVNSFVQNFQNLQFVKFFQCPIHFFLYGKWYGMVHPKMYGIWYDI